LPAALWLIAAAVGGCAGRLGPAQDAFEQARYPDALRELRELDYARRWPAEERARYALYRGLTHLALGDARPASIWLRRARAALERDPNVFDDAERGRLAAAWRAMGHMPGER
jgi:hypothetical protein